MKDLTITVDRANKGERFPDGRTIDAVKDARVNRTYTCDDGSTVKQRIGEEKVEVVRSFPTPPEAREKTLANVQTHLGYLVERARKDQEDLAKMAEEYPVHEVYRRIGTDDLIRSYAGDYAEKVLNLIQQQDTVTDMEDAFRRSITKMREDALQRATHPSQSSSASANEAARALVAALARLVEPMGLGSFVGELDRIAKAEEEGVEVLR